MVTESGTVLSLLDLGWNRTHCATQPPYTLTPHETNTDGFNNLNLPLQDMSMIATKHTTQYSINLPSRYGDHSLS